MRKLFLIALLAFSLLAETLQAGAAELHEELPPNHWAFDAIRHLNARGVLFGYEEGAFKTKMPVVRYEMIGLLSNMLNQLNIEKATQEDIRVINSLIAEFEDELFALGVKPQELDERLSKVEDGLDGWRISGEFLTKLVFPGDTTSYYDQPYYRLIFNRYINDKLSFTAKLKSQEGSDPIFEELYAKIILPDDLGLTVGRQPLGWEHGRGLTFYTDPNYDNAVDGVLLSKNWRVMDIRLGIFGFGHDEWTSRYRYGVAKDILYAADIHAEVSERFQGGVMAYRQVEQARGAVDTPIPPGDEDYTLGTYAVYAGYKILPSVELKGIYYFQDQGHSAARIYSGANPDESGFDDSARYWKAILDIKQDALKFTSLWFEYSRIDNNFAFADYTTPYSTYYWHVLDNQPGAEHFRHGDTGTTDVFSIAAHQWWWKWGGLWHTFQRFVRADFDLNGLGSATGWTLGVGRRLNEAVMIELVYDYIDYGSGNPGGFLNGNDHVFQIRSYITF